MRTVVFAATLGAAQSLAVGAKFKAPAIQALLESATTMLNGEVSGVMTPDVIIFGHAINHDINEDVMDTDAISSACTCQRYGIKHRHMSIDTIS